MKPIEKEVAFENNLFFKMLLGVSITISFIILVVLVLNILEIKMLNLDGFIVAVLSGSIGAIINSLISGKCVRCK